MMRLAFSTLCRKLATTISTVTALAGLMPDIVVGHAGDGGIVKLGLTRQFGFG